MLRSLVGSEMCIRDRSKCSELNSQLSKIAAATALANKQQPELSTNNKSLPSKKTYKPAWNVGGRPKLAAAAGDNGAEGECAGGVNPSVKKEKISFKPPVPSREELGLIGTSKKALGQQNHDSEMESDEDMESGDEYSDEYSSEEEYQPTPELRRKRLSKQKQPTDQPTQPKTENPIPASISKLKVVELRAELSKRGAPTKGLKAELVERLHELRQAESGSQAGEEISVVGAGLGGMEIGGTSAVMHSREETSAVMHSQEEPASHASQEGGQLKKVKLFGAGAQREALQDINDNRTAPGGNDVISMPRLSLIHI
eukprot:TRINITY_DN38639_c0_g2_i1.p1 TRINITY_DN38639_c0_g2~~TRINITY_DN38639_c0_g2_i1.p1  ORF type:complete len:352 (+),score=122.40 TRINITY_DN38639_c0_g2_i1:117-1058(+)